MLRIDDEDTTVYEVVVNHEEQYSIWASDRDIPPGWKAVGKRGLKPECLEYIDQVWTDMRPLSLRKKTETIEARGGEVRAEEARRTPKAESEKDPRDDLVGFLSEGNHPVEAGVRPEKSVELFEEAVKRGLVHIRFTDTRGGTELGVPIDEEASDLQIGRAHV